MRLNGNSGTRRTRATKRRPSLSMRPMGEIDPAEKIVAYCRGRYCVLSYEAVVALRARCFSVRRLEDGLPNGALPTCRSRRVSSDSWRASAVTPTGRVAKAARVHPSATESVRACSERPDEHVHAAILKRLHVPARLLPRDAPAAPEILS